MEFKNLEEEEGGNDLCVFVVKVLIFDVDLVIIWFKEKFNLIICFVIYFLLLLCFIMNRILFIVF